jgi:pimeloyl-ACP methyl ester carboxylesterase
MMGSKRNYQSLAKHKKISGMNDVYLVDLRNHGESPHSNYMTTELMAKDLVSFMDDLNLQEANIMGHSMGGRVLMETTIKYPERVKNQIISDVGPFDYYDENKFPMVRVIKSTLSKLVKVELRNQTRKSLREQVENATGGKKVLADFFMLGVVESIVPGDF